MAGIGHSTFARIYDLLMVPGDRLGLRQQRERLCSSAQGRVLEIGIGTGLNVPFYTGAAEVVGIDTHKGMLKRAVHRTWESPTPVRLVTADALHLPFSDDHFDSAVVGFSLCTIPDPESALEETARVVRPGGRLYFLEHVKSPRPRMAGFQDRIHPVWVRVSGGCRPNRDTEQLLRDSSWTIDKLWVSDSGGLIQGSATTV